MEWKRVSETGAWLFREHKFLEWMQRRTSLLWIYGAAGARKTFLTPSVLGHFRLEGPPTATGLTYMVAHHFFTKTSTPSSGDIIRLSLLAIVNQLCQDNPGYKRDIECWKPIVIAGTASSIWKQLFVDYFRDRPRALFLVLDGVDEIEDANGLRYTDRDLLDLMRDLRGEWIGSGLLDFSNEK